MLVLLLLQAKLSFEIQVFFDKASCFRESEEAKYALFTQVGQMLV